MSWTLTKKSDAFAGPGEIKRREVVLDPQVSPEEIKRREVVLDPQVSPEEIKRREVVLDPQVSPDEIKSREVELGWRVGLLLLQLFPNGEATDIVFVILFCIAGGTAITWCCGRCAMPGGHCCNILLFWRRSTAALVFRVGAYFEVSLFCPPFTLVPVHNRPTRLRGR